MDVGHPGGYPPLGRSLVRIIEESLVLIAWCVCVCVYVSQIFADFLSAARI